MHLSDKDIEWIREYGEDLVKLDVDKFYPLHCTGRKAIDYFINKYNGRFVSIKAGDEVDI